jgi:hypothetical protein
LPGLPPLDLLRPSLNPFSQLKNQRKLLNFQRKQLRQGPLALLQGGPLAQLQGGGPLGQIQGLLGGKSDAAGGDGAAGGLGGLLKLGGGGLGGLGGLGRLPKLPGGLGGLGGGLPGGLGGLGGLFKKGGSADSGASSDES